jgi:hypothetical protein
MAEIWTIVAILSVFLVVGSTLIAMRIQYRVIHKTREEREAWQQAQEGRQRTWEVRQGKHILETEKKLADQVKEVRKDWRDWRIQAENDQQALKTRVEVEQELARLPRIDEIELPYNQQGARQLLAHWQPPVLYRADLRGRDFSHLYLERADLREAQLTDANLYMADLTGACLAGANLEGANLIGANLSGADLRGANLSGANLMVADLHNAILHGATLLQMLNLAPEQLQVAVYDSTTTIDSAIDITLARIPGVHVRPNNTRSIPATLPPVSDSINQEMPQTPIPVLNRETSDEEVLPESFVGTTSDVELEEVLTETPVLVQTDEGVLPEEIATASAITEDVEPDTLQIETPIEKIATLSATTEDVEPETLQIEAPVEEIAAAFEVVAETGSAEPVTPDTTVVIDETGEEDFPESIGGKVIQLQKRTGKLPVVTGAETTSKTRGISGRGKKKGSARVSKISSISRDDDQQTRAN